MIAPYVFKSKALRALKGNWQTALLVSFFASLPLTLLQLVQATRLPDVTRYVTYEAALQAVQAIPYGTWTLLGVLSGLSLALTPVLSVGCNFYFIRRIGGEELGFGGLFSRMGTAWKSFLLFVLIYLKIFLWSLLLVVPGIMAALRYSMAPFYLAEHPEIGVLEAIRRSKEAMRGRKATFFMLQLSFMVWLLGAMLAEMLLSGVSVILALVASQGIQLAMATYLNAASAGFYRAVSEPGGVEAAQAEAGRWFRSMSVSGAFRGPFGAGSAPEDSEAEDTSEPEMTQPEDGAAEDGAPGHSSAPETGNEAQPTQPAGDGEEPTGDAPPSPDRKP